MDPHSSSLRMYFLNLHAFPMSSAVTRRIGVILGHLFMGCNIISLWKEHVAQAVCNGISPSDVQVELEQAYGVFSTVSSTISIAASLVCDLQSTFLQRKGSNPSVVSGPIVLHCHCKGSNNIWECVEVQPSSVLDNIHVQNLLPIQVEQGSDTLLAVWIHLFSGADSWEGILRDLDLHCKTIVLLYRTNGPSISY
jgi:hypothetical protein